MSQECSSPTLAGPGPARRLLRRCGWTLAAAGVSAVAVHAGVFAAALAAGAGATNALLAALAVGIVWTSLAAPAVAASSEDGWVAVCRSGALADGAAVGLLAVWGLAAAAGRPMPPWSAVAAIYAVHLGVTLWAVAVVQCGRRWFARLTLAVAVMVILAACLSTPLWIGGLLGAAKDSTRIEIACWAVRVNPFYAISLAIVEQTHFVWHQAPLMYNLSRLGDLTTPPPTDWYETAGLYLAVAGLVALARGLVHGSARALGWR